MIEQEKNNCKIMKIGIMTYHRACNYGAFLQARALCNRMNQEEDIEAEIIDFHMKKERQFYSANIDQCGLIAVMKKIARGTLSFQKELLDSFEKAQKEDRTPKSPQYMESDQIEDFQKLVKNRYDVIIAGSDEIWKVNSFRGFPTPYWLIGDLGCRKFAYAVSARVDFQQCLDHKKMNLLQNAINDFEFIGTRDQMTYDEIKSIVDEKCKVKMCCDPSFLYDFEFDRKKDINTLTENQLIKGKKNILLMTEDRKLAASIIQSLNKKYNLISVFHKYQGCINISKLSPMEWLELLYGVDMVVTSYFHATCYSILLEKPFISISTKLKKTKLEELLSEDLILKKHYIDLSNGKYHEIEWEKCIADNKYQLFPENYVGKKRAEFLDFLDRLRSSR